MLLFQIYPIFTLFWLSAHGERDEPYLNHLFCAPCPNIISPSLLPLLLPPPPSLHNHLSSAKFTDKIEATKMKDVNTLNRKTHLHTHVKMSNLLTFQHFYLVHSAFLIFREMTVMQVATLSLPAILFLLFGELDWGLTARKIESLPCCPHFTQSYNILHPPFLTLYSPFSLHLNPRLPV